MVPEPSRGSWSGVGTSDVEAEIRRERGRGVSMIRGSGCVSRNGSYSVGPFTLLLSGSIPHRATDAPTQPRECSVVGRSRHRGVSVGGNELGELLFGGCAFYGHEAGGKCNWEKSWENFFP
jgi:hypothetical protein